MEEEKTDYITIAPKRKLTEREIELLYNNGKSIMEEEKQKCLWCKKEFTQKKWKSKLGIMKGLNIVSSVCCSPSCSKKLHNSLQLASYIQDLEEELEKLKKKFNKLYKK